MCAYFPVLCAVDNWADHWSDEALNLIGSNGILKPGEDDCGVFDDDDWGSGNYYEFGDDNFNENTYYDFGDMTFNENTNDPLGALNIDNLVSLYVGSEASLCYAAPQLPSELSKRKRNIENIVENVKRLRVLNLEDEPVTDSEDFADNSSTCGNSACETVSHYDNRCLL